MKFYLHHIVSPSFIVKRLIVVDIHTDYNKEIKLKILFVLNTTQN